MIVARSIMMMQKQKMVIDPRRLGEDEDSIISRNVPLFSGHYLFEIHWDQPLRTSLWTRIVGIQFRSLHQEALLCTIQTSCSVDTMYRTSECSMASASQSLYFCRKFAHCIRCSVCAVQTLCKHSTADYATAAKKREKNKQICRVERK